MTRKYQLLTFAICSIVTFAPVQFAIGQTLTYGFSGEITAVDINENNVIPGLKAGDAFTGFATFDSRGWHATEGTVFASINGVDLLFDGPFIYGGVEVVPSMSYEIRIAADAAGDIGESTFGAGNFGPDLEDTDGSAGHKTPFPDSLNLAEFETNIFRFSGVYIETDDQLVATGMLNEFVLVSNPLLGDINLDGVVNLVDVVPFVDLVLSGSFQIEADINLDGVVNLLDVPPIC